MLKAGPSWKLLASSPYRGRLIAGIDEVGRGAWAGPVVAAAVVLPYRLRIEGVNDSKLVSPARRLALDREIRRLALAVGIGWVGCEEVDAHGLSWAVLESGLRALAELAIPEALVVLDGKHNYLRDTHESIAFVKADAKIVPVAAASIVAKVARDRYMTVLSRRHPGYGFELHKGYGTQAHQAALRDLGPCRHHRRSWGPLQRLASSEAPQLPEAGA